MWNLIVASYISAGVLVYSIIAATFYKDRNSAKKALALWVISTGPVLLAFALSLLCDHIR